MVVVYTGDLRATLHAKSGFERSVAFPLVYPYEFDKFAVHRHVASFDLGPRRVGLVVRKFLSSAAVQPCSSCRMAALRDFGSGDSEACETRAKP